MALNPINPKLRTLRNHSNDIARLSIIVAAGAEIAVPEDVAAQIAAARAPMADITDIPAPDKPVAPAAAAEDKPTKAKTAAKRS